MLTIIAPMQSEISYLRQDPTLRRWDGAAVQVLVVGVGKEAVRRRLSQWLKAPDNGSTNGTTSDRQGRLLLLGFAGAVDPALACGDLVLAGRYYWDPDTPEESCDEFYEADSAMLKHARVTASAAGLAWRGVDSLTVGRPVATGEEKAAIYQRRWRRHPVGPVNVGRANVGIVNMEDYWVAEFAARAEIPFLAVRAVIDTADQGIPSYAMGLQQRGWGALTSAVVRPWQLPNLVSLASNRRVAQRSLRRFVVAFLQEPDRLAGRLNGATTRQPVGTK